MTKVPALRSRSSRRIRATSLSRARDPHSTVMTARSRVFQKPLAGITLSSLRYDSRLHDSVTGSGMRGSFSVVTGRRFLTTRSASGRSSGSP